MSNTYSIETIQNKMLDMMEWFHRFCLENNITYFMIGGTMLGAMRHQGFIPWDDDVDIGVPREDYERLLSISKKQKENTKYTIESYLDGNTDFEYLYAKVYDTTTTLIENKRKQPKRGLYIDVFPLDGIRGTTKEEAIKNFKPLNMELNLLAAITSEVREGRIWWKNCIVKSMGILPSSMLSFSKIALKVEKRCKESSFYNSKYVGNLVGMWREREIMPREFFGTPKLYQFERCLFYGVEKPDEFLSNVYGDWRKLPPVEKQKSEHSYIQIDLEHSYRDLNLTCLNNCRENKDGERLK